MAIRWRPLIARVPSNVSSLQSRIIGRPPKRPIYRSLENYVWKRAACRVHLSNTAWRLNQLPRNAGNRAWTRRA